MGAWLLPNRRPGDCGAAACGWSSSLAQDEVLYGWGEQFGAFARTRETSDAQRLQRPLLPAAAPQLLRHPVGPQPPRLRPAATDAFPNPLADQPARHELSVSPPRGGELPADFDDTPKEILTTYTGLTGRPPLLPRWAFGLWGTGYPQENQDRVWSWQRHRQRPSRSR